MNLSKLLRKAREDAGMTQLQVSQAMGYSTPQFLSNIERSVSQAPLSALKGLSAIYKLEPEELMEAWIEDQKLKFWKKMK